MRLNRLERTFERHPIYFITAGTYDRQRILASSAVHNTVETFARDGSIRGTWLGAYVLMPDHIHVFVALDDTAPGLSSWMKSLKNSVSKSLRAAGIPSPHWQKGFFDHILRTSDSYQQKWAYVRDNPVRAGLIDHWDAWPFKGEPFPLEFRHEYL